MSRLSASDRKALPTNTFAVPSKAPGSGSYPIPDKGHAEAALREVHNAPASEQPTIRRKAEAKLHESDPPSKAPLRRQVYQTPNRQTAAQGVPRETGRGERQLDGTRSPTYSEPVHKQPLAERQAAPNRSAQQGGSGLEGAMNDLADKLHPRGGKRR